MMDWISKSLEPSTFWNAFGSILTLLAVSVALYQHDWQKKAYLDNIEKILERELYKNYKLTDHIRDTEKKIETPEGGIEIASPVKINKATADQLSLRNWSQFRFELAANRPNSYEIFEELYTYLEKIISIPEEVPESEILQIRVQTDNARRFEEKYKSKISKNSEN